MLQAITGSRKCHDLRHDLRPRVGRVFLTHPSLLAGAILFWPLSPFRDDPTTRLEGMPLLIIDGGQRPFIALYGWLRRHVQIFVNMISRPGKYDREVHGHR